MSIVFFSSCAESENVKEEKLLKEVMVIHDEMMPLIRNKIRPTQKRLEGMMKNAEQQKDSITLTKYKTAHQQLEKADKAMNDWMRQFRTPTNETPHEEVMNYLKDQKVKVAEMKKVMEENMNAAREVIEF